MDDRFDIQAKGHVKITDDDGNVLLDKDNAVHPQNMARVIARGLANEPNHQIWRIAFGNGGTEVTAANQIEYKTPNDGQPPDENTWDSRLYNEVYSEVVDEGQLTLNSYLGQDLGHSDNVADRPGGGAVPSSDPATVIHVSGPGVRSNELGLTSEVVVTCVLNQDEPTGQYTVDTAVGTQPFESTFVFDELGLYSGIAPAAPTSGYQNVDVGNKTSFDDTGLISQQYGFTIEVDGGAPTNIFFTPPGVGGSGPGGQITFGDFCEAINSNDPAWSVNQALPGGAKVYITDAGDGSYSFISGAQTFGFLQFRSHYSSGDPLVYGGPNSSISLSNYSGTGVADFFQALIDAGNGTGFVDAVDGKAQGVQNDPVNGATERERLLTHVIFSPVLKAKNRVLTITYTLTISVARTVIN